MLMSVHLSICQSVFVDLFNSSFVCLCSSLTLIYLFVHLSNPLYLYICFVYPYTPTVHLIRIPAHPTVCLSLSLFICPPVNPCLSSVQPFVCLSLHLYISLGQFITMFVHFSFLSICQYFLYIFLSIPLSVHPSIFSSLHQFIHTLVHL